MKRLLFLIFLFISISVFSHPWKPDHYVIIDTDCGLDDYRAINMLLASSSVRILAITSSDGVISSTDGYYKIKGLLSSQHMEGLPVGANIDESSSAKNCEPALDFKWNNEQKNENEVPSHIQVIRYIIENSNEKIKFIALGSLNTVNDCYENIPLFGQKITKVLWACDYENLSESFNYQIDTTSYNNIVKTDIELEIINGKINDFIYGDNIISSLKSVQNSYLDNFVSSITKPSTPFSKNIYDENNPLYLHFPGMYKEIKVNDNCTFYSLKKDFNSTQITDSIVKILKGETALRNQAFTQFPLNNEIYIEDISKMKDETIKKYGIQEWSACVITNELHRHIGAYSLVGAKMGIRAMEYFGAGTDEMQVISYAGSNPPFSCLMMESR